MRSAQALYVFLTIFLAVISQCTISTAQIFATQTGEETIEGYNVLANGTELLTISVKYIYQFQDLRSNRSFVFPENLIGEVSFSSTGGQCTLLLSNRTIRCPSGTTSFTISYRYQKQINSEQGRFSYSSSFARNIQTANANYDLSYPSSWEVISVSPETIRQSGHLHWEKKSTGSFGVLVQFQIRLSCPAGMMLAAASQSCVNVNVKYVGQTQCSASDSGFDATNATSDPPWLSVAEGKTTRVAKAEITPAGNAGSVGFMSGHSGIATVTPATATKSPETLEVTGIARGETLIGAVVNRTLGESFNVAVYELRIDTL